MGKWSYDKVQDTQCKKLPGDWCRLLNEVGGIAGYVANQGVAEEIVKAMNSALVLKKNKIPVKEEKCLKE